MSNIQTFSGGPAYAVWNSLTLKMLDEWKIENPSQFAAIKSATGVGESKMISDKIGKITFTPKIFLSSLSDLIAALWPYTSNLLGGQLVRPASDLPCVVNARNGGTDNAGLTATFYAAFLTKMPPLTFAPDKPLAGPVELTYLQALTTNVGDESSLVDTADAAYTEPGWSIADELFDRYALSLGYNGALSCQTTDSSPDITTGDAGHQFIVGQGVTGDGIPDDTVISAITGPNALTLSNAATADSDSVTLTFAPLPIVTDKEGIKFTPDCKLEMQKPGQEPTRDGKQDLVTGMIEFTPHNMDVDEFYATYFPEVGQALGQSYEQVGCQVNVVGFKGGGLTLTIPSATRAKSGHVFSRVKPRTDKVQLAAVDWYDGTEWNPLFTLSVSA